MRFRSLVPWAYFACAALLFSWGCNSSQPISPNKPTALDVSLPLGSNVRASFLGITQNEVLYRLDGPNHSLIQKGSVGPFSAAVSSGSLNFSLEVPSQDNMVLSVQLNDAATHSPLAIGADRLDLVSAPTKQISIDLGSVIRNCYFTNTQSAAVSILYSGMIYNFTNDLLANTLTPLSTTDLIVNPYGPPTNQFYFQEATPVGLPVSVIAYLGTGDLVDFDYVPASTAFYADSTISKGGAVPTLETGDIYCLKLTSTPGDFAWVQVVNPGDPASVGPSFLFRASPNPYFSYFRTPADTGGGCSTLW
ncbi:MAG TPA: hypothetical protein VHE12_10895 [bacterium]|nr:hypothetical protein [bacterium]